MSFFVSPRADSDAVHAALWYETHLPGKGDEFLGALEVAYNSIKQFPESRPQVEPDIRRVRVRPFPFHIYYRLKRDRIEVLRVVHAHRRPDAWREEK